MNSLPTHEILAPAFGERLQVNVPLKRYTAARIGGRADVLITADSSDELVDTARQLWQMEIPFIVLGSGSNVLVAEAGIRQVVRYKPGETIPAQLSRRTADCLG